MQTSKTIFDIITAIQKKSQQDGLNDISLQMDIKKIENMYNCEIHKYAANLDIIVFN